MFQQRQTILSDAYATSFCLLTIIPQADFPDREATASVPTISLADQEVGTRYDAGLNKRLATFYCSNFGLMRFSKEKTSSHFSWVSSFRSLTTMSCSDFPVS